MLIRVWVVWRGSSGGTIGMHYLGRATTTRVTVTRRGPVVTSPRTTRSPHRNHPTPYGTPTSVFPCPSSITV
ncbi:hypothetical protein Y032_0048g1722 [Ancylostoma ceylanicum]|uniref:Uncharacterized protein n=1 Tax=Ancylostoma ceylanicum TaxID=53326 RepID=A0A016UAV8_9BILA|nr:hypothetical protein Y032_0048g1722 [Ancylostoma ceylanicum]